MIPEYRKMLWSPLRGDGQTFQTKSPEQEFGFIFCLFVFLEPFSEDVMQRSHSY